MELAMFAMIIVGLVMGGYVGERVARLLGVASTEIEVGSVGDQPVYRYQGTLLGALLTMAGSFCGLFAAVFVMTVMNVLLGTGK